MHSHLPPRRLPHHSGERRSWASAAGDLTARDFAIRGRHEQRLGDPTLDEIVSCMSFYRYAVPGPRGVLLGQIGAAENGNLQPSAHARLPASWMTLFEVTKRLPRYRPAPCRLPKPCGLTAGADKSDKRITIRPASQPAIALIISQITRVATIILPALRRLSDDFLRRDFRTSLWGAI
jgi:hypothetical protein